MRLGRAALAALSTATALAACSPDESTSPAVAPALAREAATGFRTSQPAQARALRPEAEVIPILTVGDILPGSNLPWAPLPDGLGAFRERGEITLFANHELNAGGVKSSNGGPTYSYARVSRLRINPTTLRVLAGDYIEDGSGGYERLCSATWAGAGVGLPTGFFLTGEEQGASARGSIALAYTAAGQKYELPHLGSFSHENTVAVPGFGAKVVLMGLDDSNGQSELYMYVADDEAAVLAGSGKLYVFKTDVLSSAGKPLHAGNMTVGKEVPGYFVEVPDPADLSAPTPASRYARLQAKVDGLGAMPFVRIEDGDYDRSPGAATRKPAFYFVDTGNSGVRGRTQVGADCGGVCDLAGSIYRLDLNPADPTRGARLWLLDRSQGAAAGWASPDNIAVSSKSIMVMEDPAYTGFDGSRAPAIWNARLMPKGKLGGFTKVVELTQEQLIPGPAGKCVDATGGCWESSGIISGEGLVGPGTWLFDVQAHTLPFTVPNATGGQDTYAGESGQLLLLRQPGS